MDRKRHLDNDADTSVAKKLKVDGAMMDVIAQKKAEIAAKIAAMGLAKSGSGNSTSVSTPISIPSTPAPNANLPAKPAGSGAGATALPDKDEIARRVAEAKRLVAEANTRSAISANPYITQTQGKKKVPVPEVTVPQGTGLRMKAHPLLLETTPAPAKATTSKKDRFKPMAPKFASTKANARIATTAASGPSSEPVKANPYTTTITSTSARSGPHEGFEGTPKERVGRSLRFNAKGKYIQKGIEMRAQAQIESLRQRVAASAQKAGLGSEFDVVEKSFRREAPPDAEWWDQSLLPTKKYEDLEKGMETLNIRNEESPINIYIQHPIPLPPPADKNKVEPKPLKLTTKEQKKLRKQRRAAEMQDHQDRVRMGLIPPDPPKVRMANMVRVLTNDAVTDPTKLEARIRREVQQRKDDHENANAERKLTAEQRKEKIENKKVDDERKGIYGALFRIKKLSDPSHQFKVSKNAQQHGLTGVCIINPKFSLVYVEGGGKGMKHYTRLLEHRINWTQPARRRDRDDEEGDGEDDGDMDAEGNATAANNTNNDGQEGEDSLAENRCDLIWEGAIAEHTFHNFKSVRAPTDNLAREQLGTKLSSWWDSAKNWKAADEE